MITSTRRSVLFAGAAGLGLGLAGCGPRPGAAGGGSDTAPSSGELLLWHPYTQPERQAALQSAFDAYQEETGLAVKAEVVAFGDFGQRWPAAQAGGTLPDLAITTPEDAMSMWTAGALDPMDDLLAEAGGEQLYSEGALEASSRYDGQLVSLPHYVHTRIMHTRMDRLSEAGLEVPVTMEDYLAAAEAMTKTPDYYGFIPQLSQNDIGGGYLLWIMAQANGASLFTPDGTVTLTEAGVVDAARWIGDMAKFAPPSAATTPISETFNLINSGSASMTITSAAGIASAIGEAPEVAEVLDGLPMPQGSAGVGNLVGAVSFVKPKSDRDVQAHALFKHMMTGQNYMDFLLSMPLFHFPVTPEGAGEEFYGNETIAKYEVAVNATLDGIANGSGPGFEAGANPYAGSFFSASRVETALQDIAFNGVDAADAMESAQTDLQATLDEITDRM